MQNNSEVQRPPKPIWGDEITIPSETQDLINGDIYNFTIDSPEDEPSVSKPSTDPSNDLTPTEEYLEMTKQLIESNTLPIHTTKKLMQLYVKYKCSNGYDPAILDTAQEDATRMNSTNKQRHKQDKNKINKSKKPAHQNMREKEAIPSTSKANEQFGTSSTVSDEFEKSKQEESNSHANSPLEDFITPWYGLQDFMIGRPCNPDMIKIDDVFPDFTLRDAGHENALKKRIGQWMERIQADSPGSSIRGVLSKYTSSTLKILNKERKETVTREEGEPQFNNNQ